MLIKRDFYINGRWVAPIAGRDCNVINPSNEEPVAVISLGSECRCGRRQGRVPGLGCDLSGHPPCGGGADFGAI